MLVRQLARAAGKAARTRVAGLAPELIRTPEVVADTSVEAPVALVLTLRVAAVGGMPVAAVTARLETGVS